MVGSRIPNCGIPNLDGTLLWRLSRRSHPPGVRPLGINERRFSSSAPTLPARKTRGAPKKHQAILERSSLTPFDSRDIGLPLIDGALSSEYAGLAALEIEQC